MFEPIVVGVDAGFGAVKGMRESTELDQPEQTIELDQPEQTTVFPSIFGYARELDFDADRIFARYPGCQITDDDGSWFVGDLAQSQLRPEEQSELRGREHADIDRVRLIKVALGRLFAGNTSGDVVHIRLATGLPVSHMRDAETFKQALLGEHYINTDQAQFVADIIDVALMPQPYGTIYSKSLTFQGEQNVEYLKYKRVGVADLGHETFDIALDDDGEFIAAQSDSTESGVRLAHEEIAALLEREYKQKPRPADVFEVLRTGKYTAYGESIDYSKPVNKALDKVRTPALNLMRRLWRNGVDINIINLAGAGAPLIEAVVKQEYKHAIMLPNPQFGNVRGYFYYGLWKRKQAI